MKYKSKLPQPVYLYEMKEHLGSGGGGVEGLTGFVIGNFFSVTYHSGHEFNRRITNEKHRAIGFARSDGDGTKISCIRLAGLTNPLSLLVIYACFFLTFLLIGGAEIALKPEILWLIAGMTLFLALGTAFTDSITERGQEGSKMLTAFLIDPVDYYSIADKV